MIPNVKDEWETEKKYIHKKKCNNTNTFEKIWVYETTTFICESGKTLMYIICLAGYLILQPQGSSFRHLSEHLRIYRFLIYQLQPPITTPKPRSSSSQYPLHHNVRVPTEGVWSVKEHPHGGQPPTHMWDTSWAFAPTVYRSFRACSSPICAISALVSDVWYLL